jgi:hypothetical protein
MQRVRPKGLRVIAGKNRATGALRAPTKPKLLDRMREAMRSRHYNPGIRQPYSNWFKRLIHLTDMFSRGGKGMRTRVDSL